MMSVKDGEKILESYVVDTYLASSIANPIIISVAVTMMVIYLVAYLVLAVWERTKLAKPCLHMPAGDALDSSDTYYVVTVATGLRNGAGLNSDGVVRLSLSCTLQDPEPLVISNVKTPKVSPVLQRGGIDQFLLPAKGNIGEVLAIDVDLQSISNEPISWYVKYIRVTDVCFGLQSYFVFDRWLKTSDYMRTGVHHSGISPGRKFVEKFMEIFVDLNIWTAAWSRSSSTSAFSRSKRLSFSAFVFSCLMFVTILVCLIPAIQKHSRNEPIPELPELIQRTMGIGFAASLIVFLLQYTLEIILRRIRYESGTRELMIKGRNIWKKKPLPISMYPMYANRLNQELSIAPGRQQERDAYSQGDGTRPKQGIHYQPSRSANDKRTGRFGRQWQNNGKAYHNGYHQLSSVEELNTFVDERDDENVEGHTTQLRTVRVSDTDNSFYLGDALQNNSNSNDASRNQQPKSKFNEIVGTALWDEQTGIVTGYLKKGPQSKHDPGHKRSLTRPTDYQHKLQELAKNLTSAIVESAYESLGQKGVLTQPDASCIQGNIIRSFSQLSEDWSKKLLNSLSSGNGDSGSVKIGSSEGQISVSSMSPKPQSPSVTSSCPEVVSSAENCLENVGPVAKKLAESVSSAASKNSLSILQHVSLEKLATKSAERIESLSSFASSVQGWDRLVTNSSNLGTVDDHNEKTSMSNLVDYITPKRVKRLTDTSMKHVARASLKNMTHERSLTKLREALDVCNEKSTETFAYEVFHNLYQVVRAQMKDLLLKEEGQEEEELADLLSAADKEAHQAIIPPLVEYVSSLMLEQAKSLQDIDIDLVMMAFSGQYIDTIITNAVLQTHVGVLKAKSSLEDMKRDFLSKDTNRNNNKDFSVDRAIMMLEKTTEMEDVMDLLCKHMLQSYKQGKGCVAQHTSQKDQELQNAFRPSTATYETFERVLTESGNYLRLLSDNLNLSEVHGEEQYITQLSDRFLFEGFNVDEHMQVTEDLSERFMKLSLDHACSIVAEDLVQPFLRVEHVHQISNLKQETDQDTGGEPIKTSKRITRSGTPTRVGTVKKSSKDFKTEGTWGLKAENKSPASRSPTRYSSSLTKSQKVESQSTDGRYSNERRTMKLRTSPMRSSTPDPEWSYLNSTKPGRRSPSKASAISQHAQTVSRGPVSRLVYEESEITSLASAPVCPPSPKTSYDWTHPNIAGASWSEGLPYMPPEKETFPLLSSSETHLERVWRLDLERDIIGETTKCLPNCFMFILHTLICIITVVTLSMCIMFGLRLPHDIAVAWIVALVFEFLLHAFIFEPLKVSLVSLYYVYCYDETM